MTMRRFACGGSVWAAKPSRLRRITGTGGQKVNPMLPADWDLIVVGGGPGGAAVALTQPADRRVLIVDRRRAPWRKPCDGILTPMSRRVLDGLSAGLVDRCGALPTRCLSVLDRDRNRTFDLVLHDHVMVDRQELDTRLRAGFATRPGVTFRDRAHALGWMERGDQMTVRVSHAGEVHTLTASVVVDATGAAGVARRSPRHLPPTAVAVQFWYPSQGDPSRCDWIFDARATPFYMWAIHKPAGLLIGGVFPFAAARGGRNAIASLARSLGVTGSPWRVQGARVGMPRCRSDISVTANGALTVGEAANLVNAGTGEGISFALRSGVLCGRAIAATRRRIDAADLYSRAIAPLCAEALSKASHAQDLFTSARREAMPIDEVLVSVPWLSLELPA
jgi:flavin-dependent dehydrogenase